MVVLLPEPGECFQGQISDSGSGHDGMRIVNVSGAPSELTSSGSPFDTPGNARGIKVIDDRVIVADSSGVYVFDVSDIGSITNSHTYNSGSCEALKVEAMGDTVFIANGE